MKRKTLSTLILKAYRAFSFEAKTGHLCHSLNNPVKRVCWTLGVSKASVTRAIGKQSGEHYFQIYTEFPQIMILKIMFKLKFQYSF